MCDILHLRHRTFYIGSIYFFLNSFLKAKQDKLISIVHGLTGKVFESKKENILVDLDEQDQNDVDTERRLAFLGRTIESAYHGAELTDLYHHYPDRFDPDKFLQERCQKRYYYGFSVGPRSCVYVRR